MAYKKCLRAATTITTSPKSQSSNVLDEERHAPKSCRTSQMHTPENNQPSKRVYSKKDEGEFELAEHDEGHLHDSDEEQYCRDQLKLLAQSKVTMEVCEIVLAFVNRRTLGSESRSSPSYNNVSKVKTHCEKGQQHADVERDAVVIQNKAFGKRHEGDDQQCSEG